MQLSVGTARTVPSVRRLVKSAIDLIVAPASGALATIRYAVWLDVNRRGNDFSSSVLSLLYFTTGSTLALSRSPVEEDVQRFGVILYILPIDGNGLVEITHIRMGVNGHNQVFQSRCDKDSKPVAMPVYLGPWVSLD
ncbi:hypothetical protein ACEPAH_7148 [Sanghuangporus vaninii]